MMNGEGRTTWKMGECEISYERNISSMMLVDGQSSDAQAKSKSRRPRTETVRVFTRESPRV